MLSQIQEEKLTHLFKILDFDNNGTIQEDDFEAIGENLAIVRDLEFDTTEFDNTVSLTMGIWNALKPHIKGEGGTLAEWFSFMDNLLSEENKDSYQAYITQVVDKIFELFDVNNDGVISQTEYIDLFIGLRIEVRFAPKAFKRLDMNGDGILSKEELFTSVDEFMKSQSPEAPGNWIFGAWEN